LFEKNIYEETEMKKVIFASLLLVLIPPASAETTGKGKIISTQGHVAPNCRTVVHRENVTGQENTFRILDVETDDEIGTIALSALISNKDTEIVFDPDTTTGCGSEPRINSIKIHHSSNLLTPQ
jgi:hypothetical protein